MYILYPRRNCLRAKRKLNKRRYITFIYTYRSINEKKQFCSQELLIHYDDKNNNVTILLRYFKTRTRS